MEQPKYVINVENIGNFKGYEIYDNSVKFTPTYNWCTNEFKRINKLIFHDKLEIPIFKLINVKSFFGEFTGYHNKTNIIRLSIKYNRTEFEYINTLVHEMLHQWIFESGTKDNSSHGLYFKKYMKQINEIFGFKLKIITSSNFKLEQPIQNNYIIVYNDKINNESEKMLFFSIVNSKYLNIALACLNLDKETQPKLFCSSDAFFNRIKESKKALKMYLISTYAESLEDFINKYKLISLDL